MNLIELYNKPKEAAPEEKGNSNLIFSVSDILHGEHTIVKVLGGRQTGKSSLAALLAQTVHIEGGSAIIVVNTQDMIRHYRNLLPEYLSGNRDARVFMTSARSFGTAVRGRRRPDLVVVDATTNITRHFVDEVTRYGNRFVFIGDERDLVNVNAPQMRIDIMNRGAVPPGYAGSMSDFLSTAEMAITPINDPRGTQGRQLRPGPINTEFIDSHTPQWRQGQPGYISPNAGVTIRGVRSNFMYIDEMQDLEPLPE